MQHIRNALKLFAFCIIWLIIFIGCGDDKKTPVAPQNSPPKITNISVSQNILDWGQSSKLKATVEDANGQTLTYNWHSNGGEFMSATNADSAIWKAPDSTASFQIFLTVSDGEETDSDTINISVMENPILGLMNVDTLTFFARKNIASFYVHNNGTGVLDWTITAPTAAWIKQITPQAGATVTNNKTKIDIEIDREGLTGGIYNEQVVINSVEDGDDSLQIRMHVAELNFNLAALDFDSTRSIDHLSIANIGSDSLEWIIIPVLNDGGSWLTINTNHGTSTGETDTVSVSIQRQGLADGDYGGWLKIQSNGGNDSIVVNMKVVNAQMEVSPLVLDFGNRTNQLDISIRNVGVEQLNWQATKSASWLNIDPASGTSTGEIDIATVTVDRSGLAPGNYSAQINVTSNDGSATVNVSMQVPQPPVLSVSPTDHDFGKSLSSLPISIKNTGEDTLIWSITDNQSWINTSVTDGATTTETDVVDIAINRDGLTPGIYTGVVTVSSNGGNVTVNISMEVGQTPLLSVSPISLDFGESQSTRPFQIENTGEDTLVWNLVSSVPWIDVNPSSGSTTVEKDIVAVIVDRSGQLPGIYIGEITVSSNGGIEVITVRMEVVIQPQLVVSPISIDFGTTGTQRNFNIQNGGSGVLNWNISTTASWITDINPQSGSITTETDQVTVSIDRGGLSAGIYQGFIQINSNGGSAIVTVRMEVVGFPTSVFLDDFSGGLSQWLILSGQATTVNGFLELTGAGSNAGMIHDFSSTQQAPWLYRSDYGRKNNSSGGLSILWMSTNDVGTISITSYRFDIFSSGGNNWAAGAYIQSGATGQWALLESNSIGFAPEINGNAGGLNDISWAITAGKRIKIYIDGNLFYESNILNELGTNISVGLESVGFISTTSQTTRADWALVRNVDDPGGAHELIMPSNSRTREVIIDPSDLDQLDTKIQLKEPPYWQKPMTLKQVLEKINKSKK